MIVSICMATYNGESHLKEQLSSILNQKFVNNKNIELEIIISDDNSTDKTLDLIKDFNDSRIKVFKHNKKKYKSYSSLFSVTKNFENAIKYSSGDYIFLSDQDDMWYSNKLDIMVGSLSLKSCCICSFDWIDQFGLNLGSTIFGKKPQSF